MKLSWIIANADTSDNDSDCDDFVPDSVSDDDLDLSQSMLIINF